MRFLVECWIFLCGSNDRSFLRQGVKTYQIAQQFYVVSDITSYIYGHFKNSGVSSYALKPKGRPKPCNFLLRPRVYSPR